MTIGRTGTEFTVNTTAMNDQHTPAVAMLADGRFVVTWLSTDAGDGSGHCIRARLFNANGSPADTDFVVNTTSAGDQNGPSVAALPDGRFMVTWESDDPGDGDWGCIRGRLFNADGSDAGGDFIINTWAPGDQGDPGVTTLSDGRLVVTWHSYDPIFGSYDVMGRLLGANGNGTDNDFLINTTWDAGLSPRVAGLGDGRFVVTWRSGSGTDTEVRARIFNGDGTAAGTDFVVNTTPTENWLPLADVAALSDGRFVVTWMSDDGGDGSWSCIRGRVFNADGSASADDFIVNGTASGPQFFSDVTALADGRFVVTWFSSEANFSQDCIRSRVFNSDGSPAGEDFVTPALASSGFAVDPSVTALSDGRFVVTWASDNPGDGSGTSIRGQIFDPTRFIGGAADDVWHGGDLADGILGGFGNDRLWGHGGDDVLSGGADNDFADGGQGNDRLDGGAGADVLHGGDGDDRFSLSRGGDNIDGGGGVDTLAFSQAASFAGDQVATRLTVNLRANTAWLYFGDSWTSEVSTVVNVENVEGLHNYSSFIFGDDHDNYITGGREADHLYGGGGNDWIDGGNGYFNILSGEAGNDTLVGGNGPDSLYGNEDNDRLIGSAANDLLDGGDGIDIVDYSWNGMAVQIDLAFGEATGIDIQTDQIVNIENAIGGDGDDRIIGNTLANRLEGSRGDDWVEGGAGNDSLDGGNGFDTVSYSGARGDYQITRLANGDLQVTDRRAGSPDGTDTLHSIEQFNLAGVIYTTSSITDGAAPVITSNDGEEGATVDIAENRRGVTTVVANDPDGPTVTYSIAGGSDAACFQIDAGTGALSFVAAPDFEAPGDINGDNSYVVEVRATDGTLSDFQTITVNVTNLNDDVPSLGDVLWRHTDGTLATATHNLGLVPNNWRIASTGDFDGDGDTDLLWRHRDGMVVTWEMENGRYVTNHNIAFASTGWEIVDTGDFDADGDADVLWRHRDGAVVTWEMEDGRYVVNHNIAFASPGWRVDGLGDFDADGDADIIWRHREGAVTTWEMEDGDYVINHNIEFGSTDWQIEGTGDFDADGDDDILWRHQEGRVIMWEMADGDYVVNHNFVRQPHMPPAWHVQGIEDFDSDGDADILWRHDDGAVTTWSMQADDFLQSRDFGIVSNAWQIVRTGEFDLA